MTLLEMKAAGAGGSPVDAQYVTLALDARLTDERVLTGTANQITLTDGGAGGNITLSLPQDYDTGATPTLGGLTLTSAAVIAANSVVLQPAVDAVTFFQILDADGGTPVLNVDTTNEQVGIGTAAPNEQLEITGNFRMPASTATTGIIYRAGNPFIHTFANRNSTFVGDLAGNLTNTGNENVGVGTLVLNDLTDGISNMALGALALQLLTTGDRNCAVGTDTLSSLTTGTDNMAIGSSALTNLVSAVGCIAIGSIALRDSIAAGNAFNVAIGHQSQFANATGIQNTGIGNNTGDTNTTGNYNTWIGTNADSSVNNLSESIAIGKSAIVSASNMCILGGTGGDSVQVAINATLAIGQLDINVNAAARIGVIVKGAAAQSANLQEWQDSTTAIVLNVQADGDLEFGEAVDIVAGTTTGTMIGQAANQKLGFFGQAPRVQIDKASFNNWAAFGDIVDALVALGLFDAA